MITIITATYNRAASILELYASLCKQQKHEFEWVVIDDGSEDGTQGILKKIQCENNLFQIKVIYQDHGGKHRALNKGIAIAKGEWCFIVDSDDYLTNDALLQVEKFIEQVDDPLIAGVAGLKIRRNGTIIGGMPKIRNASYIDASNLDRRRYRLLKDKAEVYRTEILRKYPFPEFENETFITEAVCWDAIAYEGYYIRWYPVPIYVCEYRKDGLTLQGANKSKGFVKNYRGYCYYVSQCMNIKPFLEKIVDLSRYYPVAVKKNRSIVEQADDLKISRPAYFFYIFLAITVGFFLRGVYKLEDYVNEICEYACRKKKTRNKINNNRATF